MMPTFTAPMLIDAAITERTGWVYEKKRTCHARALVLIELVVIMAIMAIVLTITSIKFSGFSTRAKFDKQADALINVLKKAQYASAQGNQRYAVILNFVEQTYTLRPYEKTDWEVILEEEPVMSEGRFTEACYLEYVLFDDGVDTRETIQGMDMVAAWLFAGHSGWQNGGKIVLLDADGYPYTIIFNRLSKIITLHPGDVDILEPRLKEDVPF